MPDLPTRLRTRADLHDTLTAGLMRDAADEIERLGELAEHWKATAGDEADIGNERAAERDAAEAAVARLKAERLVTDRRIRAQRAALRKNWEIVEQRVGLRTTLRMFRMLQARGKELRAAEAENVRLREALAGILKPFPTVLGPAEDMLEDWMSAVERFRGVARRALKPSPASSPIVKTEAPS